MGGYEKKEKTQELTLYFSHHTRWEDKRRLGIRLIIRSLSQLTRASFHGSQFKNHFDNAVVNAKRTNKSTAKKRTDRVLIICT